MKVSCLMATYGRKRCVETALAQFLDQDYADRELVILNNHPAQLRFEHPLVRIVNEPGHPTLGHCRNRLLDFATGDLVRTWDDDDLYLPWTISQGVEGFSRVCNHEVCRSPCWKPTRSWWYDGSGMGSGIKRKPCFELAANAMEASITFQARFVRKAGYFNGQGEEHKFLTSPGVHHEEMGEWASYCYVWGAGQWHASGSIGNGRTAEERAADWKTHNTDAEGGLLVPAKARVRRWFHRWVRFISPNLQTAWVRRTLGLPWREAKPHEPRTLHGRIVAAPGCFDLLHEGHVATLEWARRQGDSLAVLINDDEGVMVQKGDGRPLVPLAGRVASLMSLDCVDAVLVVEGRDDMPTLAALKPAVLVKGPEYAGRNLTMPAGCELRTAPEAVPGHTRDLTTL